LFLKSNKADKLNQAMIKRLFTSVNLELTEFTQVTSVNSEFTVFTPVNSVNSEFTLEKFSSPKIFDKTFQQQKKR